MELHFAFRRNDFGLTDRILYTEAPKAELSWPPIMGVPFAFHDYKDIISASPGLDYAEKRNVSHSANGLSNPVYSILMLIAVLRSLHGIQGELIMASKKSKNH